MTDHESYADTMTREIESISQSFLSSVHSNLAEEEVNGSSSFLDIKNCAERLISSAYPVAVTGSDSRTSDMRGERVTTTPPTQMLQRDSADSVTDLAFQETQSEFTRRRTTRMPYQVAENSSAAYGRFPSYRGSSTGCTFRASIGLMFHLNIELHENVEKRLVSDNWNVRRPGAAHSVAWRHHKREIQLDSGPVQPGSILALVLPSGGITARYRNGATAERFFHQLSRLGKKTSPIISPSALKPIQLIRRSIRVNSRTLESRLDNLGVYRTPCFLRLARFSGARWPKWSEREFTDRKVRGSNPTSASRLPLSRLGQPDSIPALVQPSGGMAVRHRKGARAERLIDIAVLILSAIAIV
ncbi:hypothetical protein CSKR_112746, partial [Clonorchis sinensis]